MIFEPKDFLGQCLSVNPIKYVGRRDSELIAEWANDIFSKKLTELPEVFCRDKSDQRFWGVSDSTNQVIPHECEMKARLIDIKENK